MKKSSVQFSMLLLSLLSISSLRAEERTDSFLSQMPERWEYTSDFSMEFPTEDEWWKGFSDQLLDSLIMMGETRNFNLSQAARRIEIARQTVRSTKSGYYPQLNLDLGWSKQRTSGRTMKGGIPTDMSYFSAGIDMNWEIDIFGKVRESVKEQNANLNVSRADYAAVSIALCSEIATDYLTLRMLQEENAVTQRHIQSQERVLKITEARYEAGLASMLDVSQAKTDYYATLSSISAIETQIATTINAIAVLIGEYPEKVSAMLNPIRPLPEYSNPVYVGVPMELLRRRPDIVEAEYTLASYAAACGVAKKDFLPTLSLTGSIGTESRDIKDLFSKNSIYYNISPTLSWTIFNGMAREADIASAKAQLLAGVDAYNQTILTAIQEVENALFTYRQAIVYEKQIEEVLTYAEQSFNLALDRYKQGLDAFINVTDAQMTVLQYANEVVEAKGATQKALVSMYKALGGGWNIDKLRESK